MYTNDSSSAFVTRGNRRGKGFFPPRTDVCDESSATPAVMIGGLLHTCTSSAHSLEILLFPFLFICYFFHWSLSKSVNNFVKKNKKTKNSLKLLPMVRNPLAKYLQPWFVAIFIRSITKTLPSGDFFSYKSQKQN